LFAGEDSVASALPLSKLDNFRGCALGRSNGLNDGRPRLRCSVSVVDSSSMSGALPSRQVVEWSGGGVS
jgi:hypothetical protein